MTRPFGKVRFLLAAIIVLAAAGILVPPTSANPPSAMDVTYNEIAKELKITITHPVADPSTHYIGDVRVTVNGKLVNETRFTRQPSSDTFSFTIPLETPNGADTEVTATCILGGSLSRHWYHTVTVATTPMEQKAAAGLVPVIGAAALAVLAQKRRT